MVFQVKKRLQMILFSVNVVFIILNYVLNFLFEEPFFAFGSSLRIIGIFGHLSEGSEREFVFVILLLWMLLIPILEVLLTFFDHRFAWGLNVILVFDIVFSLISHMSFLRTIIAVTASLCIMILTNITKQKKLRDGSAIVK